MSPRRRQALSLVVFLAGVVVYFFLFVERSNPDVAENRDYPITDDERLVVAELIKHLPSEALEEHGPRFIQWGPHITQKEVGDFAWPDGRPDGAVRVVFLLPSNDGMNEFDWCFFVAKGRAWFLGFNDYGDDWKKQARRGTWPRNPPNHPPIVLPIP